MKTVQGKVVVLGSSGVGKTSIISRYVHKSLSEVGPTIGASFVTCKISLDTAKIIFQVWDTAGQERYRSMAPMYYRNTHAAFLVFDITDYNSFVNIKVWVTELKRHVEQSIILILIGNKLDLCSERQVDAEEAKRYATSIGASYYETSAYTEENIESVMLATAYRILKLSEGESVITSLKIYDDSSLKSISEVPLSEETLTNMSIAHGTKARTFFCC